MKRYVRPTQKKNSVEESASKLEDDIVLAGASVGASAHSIAASRTSALFRNNSHLLKETYLATFLEWLDGRILALYIATLISSVFCFLFGWCI